MRTGIAAERFGWQVLDTGSIENFISCSHTEGPRFATQLESHVGDYDVDVMNLQTATALVPAAEEGGLHEIVLENGASLRARTLILSTGARWRQMTGPGENDYRNKGVPYCPPCAGPLITGTRVPVDGGDGESVVLGKGASGKVE